MYLRLYPVLCPRYMDGDSFLRVLSEETVGALARRRESESTRCNCLTMTNQQIFIRTLIVIGTLAGLYLLFRLRDILFLLFFAVLFASTIRPLVAWLEERARLKRAAAILMVYLATIVIAAGAIIVLIPTLVARAQELAQAQDQMLNALYKVLQDVRIFAFFSANIWLPIPTASDLQGMLGQAQSTLQEGLRQYLSNGFQAMNDFLVVFVMAFYWLTERDNIEDLVLRMLPLGNRDQTKTMVNDMESALGAYVRGQGILCLTMAILSFAGLTLLGIPYALLVAVVAGLTEAVPLIGPILGAVAALGVTLIAAPERVILVLILYTLIQQLELNVLVPKVMERQVGLSPLLVILAIAGGNLLGGLMGAVVAVPIMAVIQILARNLVIRPTLMANAPQVIGGGVLLSGVAPAVTVEGAQNVNVRSPGQVTFVQSPGSDIPPTLARP